MEWVLTWGEDEPLFVRVGMEWVLTWCEDEPSFVPVRPVGLFAGTFLEPSGHADLLHQQSVHLVHTLCQLIRRQIYNTTQSLPQG